MAYPDTFEGFAVHDPSKWSEVKKIQFTPRPFQEDDVDIKIEACGICSSDIHTISGGWGQPKLPSIVGHEIVGTVVRVGSKVDNIKVGDTVGMGAMCWADLTCDVCKSKNENYCPNWIDTYDDAYPDGSRTYGGYSNYARCNKEFAFKIPKGLSVEGVAPMLCAGITTYSPLKRNNIGPGKKVGVVGIGGLGHFALQFAKALGAEVYAISRNDKKKADALKLGADYFIETEKEGWNLPYKYKFDLIISTANSSQNFDLDAYVSTLNIGAKFVSVGLPEDKMEMNAGSFIKNGCYFGSSHLGNREEMKEMLELAAEKGIEAWYEPISISQEGIKNGLEKLHRNDVKYRFTLTNYGKQFE
ncbi:NADPH-dependent medium chain alcohol dehydrogenase [Komagataella phaffii CBS 7435]|uniref:alcohol dehydrogenase (NADP(+)) n=2 Tax=Komagataella phaffii TaxID=460519 RepID=C4QWW0_KOMPG|nr:NADPH-dependent medium chain alcohol dehydrogenase with broad substrate specificity [Komagataella phaffii GS115]AOA60964.1 GQ67_02940T0 [Komagataella phaffii]CAH2446526.1 NADPH-dependent medium chain alcohol dehydrogenase [Komagataella phaffii CBS 7435]AOA65834.1 GQ68_02307T0 [Komagataella phaffii GS115]CAY67733.1 NADPH-dependent medium chain alcohol dehydrogenase with broad substrate specificity [Komagataella phaffii GS115]CCA36820.1 NADPH-dependent medium chain alcohol dehydrogenase [Koma